MSYSTPVQEKMRLAELRKHLHTLPEHPDWIPYRTSYYKEDWAFCLRHSTLLTMSEEEDFEVLIDSSLKPGSLTYGEYLVPGQSSDEILISCHACHPAMCNDNLSGVALATFLAQTVSRIANRLTYRFLFLPATIGAITWLSLNENALDRIRGGLVLACVGDAGSATYKKSRRGDSEIDRASLHVFRHRPGENRVIEFAPYGYDERQYCSPGFDMPVGCLMRSGNEAYPEYHTSADDLDLINPSSLADSLRICSEIFFILENNAHYINTQPKGEPQLGRRGLYRSVGGRGIENDPLAMLWILNQSDGSCSLLDIADRAGMPFHKIHSAAERLIQAGLLVEATI
jgi:aminopeptidase-like protein